MLSVEKRESFSKYYYTIFAENYKNRDMQNSLKTLKTLKTFIFHDYVLYKFICI